MEVNTVMEGGGDFWSNLTVRPKAGSSLLVLGDGFIPEWQLTVTSQAIATVRELQ